MGWRVESRETKFELEYSIKVVDPEIAGDRQRDGIWTKVLNEIIGGTSSAKWDKKRKFH